MAPTQRGRIGVLLTNLGTPDAPDAGSVRRFLREFLSDPRVVDVPRVLWWLILNLVILVIRPPRSAALYKRVWTAEGSPLLIHSKAQQRALAAALPDMTVVLGMRYGKPSIEAALAELASAGADRLLVLPLYPQYSATTSASTFDAIAQAFRRVRHLPELRFVPDYHDDEGYISALAQSINEAWATGARGQKLLMSFHGIPQRYAKLGDPYPEQCANTAARLAHSLGLKPDEWALSYQSRVGREPWLQPYTDKLLEGWAKEGTTDVDVVCPGFSSDCLETVDEIGHENKELFLDAGGTSLRYIPALNARESHIQALSELIQTRCADWRAAP